MSASQLPTARAQTVTRRRAAARRPEPVPLVLDRYRLGRRLGAGAFGTVWVAHDEHLDREVALKIVAPECVQAARLEREAKAAARLAHPGIVTLYEAARDDHGAYLVSELVHGATLHRMLCEGRLSDRDVLRIAVALCDALEYAHSQGVIHRDVKPSNILVPEHPASPAQLAKLTDFGVARVIGGDALTRTGDVVGTLAYMAPEQAEGLETGAPADLFALALVTYEALTGVNPVRTGTAAQRSRRLGAHLPPLRRQRRELPRELGRVVDLALRPRPRERGTLAELRQALVQSIAEVEDMPGIVGGSWRAPRVGRREDGPPEWDQRPLAPDRPPAPDPVPELMLSEAQNLRPARPRPAPPVRLAAALATAIAALWLAIHVLPSGSPAALPCAALAGVAVLALPRLGWLLSVAVLVAIAWTAGHPGASLLIAACGIAPVLLSPRDGIAWPAATVAVALGLAGIGGAWPAVAGRAQSAWRRAVLGAVGWLWLALLGPLAGRGLYLRSSLPGLDQAAGWSGSLHSTMAEVVRPIASSGALAGAPVWALAAVVLPWLLRGRSLAGDALVLAGWALATVWGCQLAIALVHPGGAPLASLPAVLGALLAGAIALAPWGIRTLRGRPAVP